MTRPAMVRVSMAAVQVDIVELLKALTTEDLVNAVSTACLGRPEVITAPALFRLAQ